MIEKVFNDLSLEGYIKLYIYNKDMFFYDLYFMFVVEAFITLS